MNLPLGIGLFFHLCRFRLMVPFTVQFARFLSLGTGTPLKGVFPISQNDLGNLLGKVLGTFPLCFPKSCIRDWFSTKAVFALYCSLRHVAEVDGLPQLVADGLSARHLIFHAHRFIDLSLLGRW